MAYVGLVPSEHSSGANAPAAGSPKRAMRISAGSWSKRPGTIAITRSWATPCAGGSTGNREAVCQQAWQAQHRLHQRYRQLTGRGKRNSMS